MGDAIDRAILLIARAFAVLGAAAIAAMTVIVVASVVMRYLVGAPFRFSEELGGLLLALSVFLTLPYALAAHLNIRVTLASDALGATGRRVAWIAGQAIVFAFAAIFAWESWKITQMTLLLRLRTEQARLDMGPWMIAMTASFACLAAIAAWQATRPPRAGGMKI